MKREIVSIAFILMLFVAMQLSSLPLVKATIYPDGYPDFDFPPDYYLEGDFDHNGRINICDVVRVTSKYGLHEGDEGWDPIVDLNDDGVIDIYDVTIITGNYGQGEPLPVAYSTSFEFIVPDDGDTEVCYYCQIEFYIPPELDGQFFWLTASVDDSFGVLKIDGTEIGSGGSGDFTESLTYFCEGFHQLDVEFIESIGAGHISLSIATSSGEEAWFVRFRVHVPNYSDTDYRYTVKTETWCPILDDYFLVGYADDYIDDVGVDGTVWQDWEWGCGSYGAIYAWGDGFCYPLGRLPKETLYDISFSFGEIWGGGLLDFRYVSWTDQREYWLRAPKFCAVGNLNQADYITINSAMFYGGSKWKFEDDPQFSERYFEARQVINASYDDGGTWFNTSLETGLGLGWAEWALLPATEDDMGVTMNLTRIQFESNRPDGFVGGDYCFWDLRLEDHTLDVYSFPALEIKGLEFTDEGESIVDQDLTVAIDYTGTVIMFTSSYLIGGTPGILGATVGLAIKGIAATIKLSQGQIVCRCEETISEDHHRQLCFTSIECDSDVVFFKLNPAAGKHCGMTKIVLKGTLRATYWILVGGIPPRDILEFPYPIGNIEITLCIPWFLRG